MKKRYFKIAAIACMAVMMGSFVFPVAASAATTACDHKYMIFGYIEEVLYDMDHICSYEMDVDGDGEMETVTNDKCHVVIKLCTPANICKVNFLSNGKDCEYYEVSDLVEPHREETHTKPCGVIFKDILP